MQYPTSFSQSGSRLFARISSSTIVSFISAKPKSIKIPVPFSLENLHPLNNFRKILQEIARFNISMNYSLRMHLTYCKKKITHIVLHLHIILLDQTTTSLNRQSRMKSVKSSDSMDGKIKFKLSLLIVTPKRGIVFGQSYNISFQ